MFSEQVELEAKQHAESEYPKESCGIVMNNKYRPKKNIYHDPENGFEIEKFSKNLKGIFHSHPLGLDYPSATDMRSQMSTQVPWGIIPCKNGNAQKIQYFGDQCSIPDLIGREFKPGIFDCYSMVRHYYKLKLGINVKDFPREYESWEDDLNTENFKKANFTQISNSIYDLQVHDGILMAVGSNLVNHCAVYIGNDLIIHHLYNRLSRREPIAPWQKKVRAIMRYNRD